MAPSDQSGGGAGGGGDPPPPPKPRHTARVYASGLPVPPPVMPGTATVPPPVPAKPAGRPGGHVRGHARGGRPTQHRTVPGRMPGEPAEESEEWVISYMDMVTLLMIVFLGMVAILGINGRLKLKSDNNQPGAGRVAVSANPVGAPARDMAKNPTAASMSSPTLPQVPPYPPQRPPQDALPPDTLPGAGPAEEPTEEAKRLAQDLEAQDLPPDVQVTPRGKGLSIEIKDRVLFASGRADLGDEGQQILSRLVPVLQSLKGMVTVEGHTDSNAISTARFPSNWELSAARAAAVVRMLISDGVPANRLRAVGYADTRPHVSPPGANTDPNAPDHDRAADRRVTLIVETP
ncbi:OmpA/MotB family protein [Nitrospirillum amazonense]|uniref:Chemotaxis protein MotB n=1 Tax=Nitrospirillum amazonense TaxID=28077 RepID=A0A560JV85_9PROT|nr:OmpA family protein [Nitrospirillum amazonense]MDG3440688.1 OmpA family protein [Nitrospirillum amazonense]TWB74978.1 chemotaxis protein MotB [Nitrospirillum amazonense]